MHPYPINFNNNMSLPPTKAKKFRKLRQYTAERIFGSIILGFSNSDRHMADTEDT